jgi:hypothetical protein
MIAISRRNRPPLRDPFTDLISLPSWFTAITGAGITLLAYYVLTKRSNEPAEPGQRKLATVPVRR